MTQKDKKLLLKDLCARLPYGVKVQVYNNRYAPTTLTAIDIKRQECIFNFKVPVENCLPYLRPMSGMTEEEKKNLLVTIVGNEGSKYFRVLQDGSIDNTDSTIQDLNKFNIH